MRENVNQKAKKIYILVVKKKNETVQTFLNSLY